MKNKYSIYILILCMVLIQSCGKSFLEAPPQNVLPREEVIANIDDCEKLFRSTYADFALSYGTFTNIYPELVADNIKLVTAAQTLKPMYNWSQIADDSRPTDVTPAAINMNGLSYRFYNLIRTSNYLIEKAEEFKGQNPIKSDYITASALTVRAYSYFMLINVFAQPYNYSHQATHPGVVYVTSSNWTDPIRGRSTVAEVYNKIIGDLERAIPLYHEETTTTLRYNKDLSAALLSRVLLSAGNYSSSLKYAKNCISKYPLLTIEKGYPDNIFIKSTPQESEVLFHLLPLSSNALGYDGTAPFSNLYCQLLVHFIATSEAVQMLTQHQHDVRRNWVADGGTAVGWKVNKFTGGAVPDIYPTQLNYFMPLARMSEMYLNASECFYNLQQEDSARHYLNKIILRADPTAPSVSASGQQLLSLIRDERRKELIFEGFRLFDLQRWKRPIIRLDEQQFHKLDLPSDKAIAPLPKQDLRSSVPQNSGY